MFLPYQLSTLIELAAASDMPKTMEEVTKLIQYADEKGHVLAASVLGEYLGKLATGQRLSDAQGT